MNDHDEGCKIDFSTWESCWESYSANHLIISDILSHQPIKEGSEEYEIFKSSYQREAEKGNYAIWQLPTYILSLTTISPQLKNNIMLRRYVDYYNISKNKLIDINSHVIAYEVNTIGVYKTTTLSDHQTPIMEFFVSKQLVSYGKNNISNSFLFNHNNCREINANSLFNEPIQFLYFDSLGKKSEYWSAEREVRFFIVCKHFEIRLQNPISVEHQFPNESHFKKLFGATEINNTQVPIHFTKLSF